MAYNLPTNFALDDPNHVAAHNNTNAAVNDLDSRTTSIGMVANTALQPAYIAAGTGITKTGSGTSASPLTLSTMNGASLRRDMTVGERVIATIGGVETVLYCDTGWRNIMPLLTVEGYTFTGSLLLRRNLNIVSMQGAITASGPIPKLTQFISGNSIVGFRPYGNTTIAAVRIGNPTNGTTGAGMSTAFNGFYLDTQWTDQLYVATTWVTNDTWPSTLPGTPA